MEQNPIHFEPWQGELFKSGEGQLGSKRLLVLGEAHYSDHPEDETPELTCNLLQTITDGTRSIAYFTKLEHLLAGCQNGDGRRRVWASIAFYNFVQGFVAKKARERPSEEMWEAGRAPFARVLAELKPQRVLVTGVELWNALSHGLFPGWTSRSMTPGFDGPIYEWSSVDHQPQVCATWISHPSSVGFAYEKWTERIDTLME